MDAAIQRAWRIRIPLFLLAGTILVIALSVFFQAVQTLRVLDVVERQRDGWQRPDEIIAGLNLRQGSTAAELGSGAGYFALKLARRTGNSGEVFAVDMLREPLAFLWIRALLQHRTSLHIIHTDLEHADAENVRLPGRLDAVLIANTYHEFRIPEKVLVIAFESLRPGGRLVVVDRGPLPGDAESPEAEAEHHERAPAEVEKEIRRSGFEVISRDDRFIESPTADRPGDRPDDHGWWLIVAGKP